MTSQTTWCWIAPLTAVAVTIATFGKSFVPFYLLGSTTIFVAACLTGLGLLAFTARSLAKRASSALDFLIVVALLYCVVIATFFFHSLGRVPVTHLFGILMFNGLFLLFGFAASRALVAVFAVLLAMAAIYLLFVAQYTIRFGDLMRNGFLQDVFGVGVPALVTAFHQNIGASVGIAAVIAASLAVGRMRFIGLTTLPLVFWFLFHIAARTAMVALTVSLLYWVGAVLWNRSWKLASTTVAVVIVSATIGAALFYQYALDDKAVNTVAPDAISRTIREIQDPNPLFRMQIWARAINRIAREPDKLLLGRGIGVFPIDEGYGPPNWLLTPAEGSKYYPHNVFIEALYEVGVVGLLPLLLMTLLPLFISLRRWNSYLRSDRTAILLYVFSFTSAQLSGALALSYDFHFFLGIAIGVIALSREHERAGVTTAYTPSGARFLSGTS